MTLELVPGGDVNLVGCALIVALGVAAGRVKPHSAAQAWFTAFAIAFGLGAAFTNWTSPDDPALLALLWALAAVGFAAAGAALLGLTAVGVGRSSLARNALLLGAAMAAMLAIGWGTLLLGAAELPEAFGDIDTPWTPTQEWATLAVGFYTAATWTAGIAFALGARKGDAAVQAQAALMSSALILYSAVYWGGFFARPFLAFQGLFLETAAGAVALAATWLWVSRDSPRPALARNAALVPLVLVVVGMILGFSAAVPGITRILMTAVLAYAIVRHKVLGIDAKVRFGFSRGTVAAVFIAVFFGASELAQVYFGQAFQSEYVGILGAGALVFAMSPLSRAADRLAERAIPVRDSEARPSPRPAMAEAESDYATALAAAMRDGRITPEEEMALARLADRAGLGAAAVTRIRHEVEARSAGAPQAGVGTRRGRRV